MIAFRVPGRVRRPGIRSVLHLEEVAAAIEDPAKLIFLAENGDGEVVGQILCELEMQEEDEAAETVAEPAVEAVEEAAEAAAEPVAEAVEEAAETVAEAAEGVLESAAEAAEPVPAAPMPEEAEPEAVEAPVPTVEEKGPRAEKLVIANIYVVDSARRQRVGTELYHEALREARKMGCTAAELSCWNFDKEGVYFFEKLGYKSLLVTMEKKLGD